VRCLQDVRDLEATLGSGRQVFLDLLRVDDCDAMTLRDDHIRIPLSGGTFVLPRGALEALLGELRQSDSMRNVREAFEAIESPELLRLASARKVALIQLIEQWGGEMDGGLNSVLPPRIFELRNALRHDLARRSERLRL
jgi:hypothetical protein